MPTPFQHLTYALALLTAPALPESIRAAPGPFLLGNTAADVQALTGQDRAETHFYTFPPARIPRAGAVFLTTHPQLAAPQQLAPEHAAFISGYLAHLAYDEFWAWDIYCPFYLESTDWPDRLTRSIHHNALRVWLDRQATRVLAGRPDVPAALQQAAPCAWLPFAADHDLRRWRDWLMTQLLYPETIETVAVFAARMNVPATELEAAVSARAAGRDAAPVPGLPAALARFEPRARADGLRAIIQYWAAQPRSAEDVAARPALPDVAALCSTSNALG